MTDHSPPSTQATTAPARWRRSKVMAVVVAICCVALATVGVRFSEVDQNFEVVQGSLGDARRINGGEVTGTRVRVGTTLKRNDTIEGQTTGMFVVVTVMGAAPGSKAFRLSEARLLTDDAEYASYTSSDSVSAQPGFVSTQDFTFEVDPAGIDDLTLESWQSEILVGYHQRFRVHLGITPGNAQAWRDAARNQTVELGPVNDTKAIS